MADSTTVAASNPRPGGSNNAGSEHLALVLKGGGAKGLALAGAVDALERLGRGPNSTLVGTSAGAIAAVLLAWGASGTDLQKLLSETDFSTFEDGPLPWLAPIRGWMHSGRRLQSWVLAQVVELEKRRTLGAPLRAAGLKLSDAPDARCVVLGLSKRGVVVFDSKTPSGSLAVDRAVRMSASLPFFFKPLEHDGDRVYDGGLRNNFPVGILKQLEPAADWLGLYLDDSLGAGAASVEERWFSWKSMKISSEILEGTIAGDDASVLDSSADQVVRIDTSPIATTDFKLSGPEKSYLVATGRAAVYQFAARTKPAWVRRPDTLAQEALAATKEAGECKLKVSVERRRRRVRQVATRGLLIALSIVVIAYLTMRAVMAMPPANPCVGTWTLQIGATREYVVVPAYGDFTWLSAGGSLLNHWGANGFECVEGRLVNSDGEWDPAN